MSYTYLFKYIIIGDTGREERIEKEVEFRGGEILLIAAIY